MLFAKKTSRTAAVTYRPLFLTARARIWSVNHLVEFSCNCQNNFTKTPQQERGQACLQRFDVILILFAFRFFEILKRQTKYCRNMGILGAQCPLLAGNFILFILQTSRLSHQVNKNVLVQLMISCYRWDTLGLIVTVPTRAFRIPHRRPSAPSIRRSYRHVQRPSFASTVFATRRLVYRLQQRSVNRTI